MDKDILDILFKISKDIQKNTGSHGFDHTKRVIKLCNFLGNKLGANMDILLPAAILHDIARSEENHAKIGSQKSRKILRERGIDEERINSICEVIESHSFSAKKEPKSLEAKILSDADKLDALGAIGIYRTAAYSYENSKNMEDFINHFYEKLLKLKDQIYTDEAYEYALSRHNYLEDYLKRINDEIEIKDI
jgi:uncharacterized protein